MKHEIKCWPEPFQAAWAGVKPFEIREDDRGYKEHQEIVLMEWCQTTQEYTGREIHGFITYVTSFRQKKNYCVFSYAESMRVEA